MALRFVFRLFRTIRECNLSYAQWFALPAALARGPLDIELNPDMQMAWVSVNEVIAQEPDIHPQEVASEAARFVGEWNEAFVIVAVVVPLMYGSLVWSQLSRLNTRLSEMKSCCGSAGKFLRDGNVEWNTLITLVESSNVSYSTRLNKIFEMNNTIEQISKYLHEVDKSLNTESKSNERWLLLGIGVGATAFTGLLSWAVAGGLTLTQQAVCVGAVTLCAATTYKMWSATEVNQVLDELREIQQCLQTARISLETVREVGLRRITNESYSSLNTVPLNAQDVSISTYSQYATLASDTTEHSSSLPSSDAFLVHTPLSTSSSISGGPSPSPSLAIAGQ